MFNKKDFDKLSNYTNDYPLISIYVPTHRAGEATWNGKDALVLKNKVLEIKKKLNSPKYDLNHAKITSLLEPVVELYENSEFWLNQSDGLAIFLSKDFFKYYHIPKNFNSSFYIGKGFHLTSLVSFIKQKNRFFLLDLNQKHIRLFECMDFSITEIKVKDVMPINIEEALPEEHHSTTLQFHSTNGNGPIYHGQGGHKSELPIDLEKFFRLINKGVEQLLHDEKVPLLLAGVDYLIPIYKSVSTYNFLIEDRHISGNVQDEDLVLLHEKAILKMQPTFEENKRNLIKKYNEVSNSNLATDELQETVKAAYNGRVDTLFLKENAHSWGSFDEKKQSIVFSESPDDSSDLLNSIAIQCITNGGNIYLLEEEDMPCENTDACAILRY
ncbi:MAG: hypothetical protein R3E32_26735 [Chitinophagales bacterium]